jgi:hypothetical protein
MPLSAIFQLYVYVDEDLGPGFRQAYKCGGVKLVNVIPTPHVLIIRSLTSIQGPGWLNELGSSWIT